MFSPLFNQGISKPTATRCRELWWRVWRDDYLKSNRKCERIAWVAFHKYAVDAARTGDKTKLRMATVRQIWHGGLQLQTNQPFAPGAVLQVEVWDRSRLAPGPFSVRVLRVDRRNNGEWILNCTFARATKDEATQSRAVALAS